MRRAYALGLMRTGYLLEWSSHEHAVNNTVSWSKTLIEGLYLGADWNFKCLALEYAAPAQTGVTAAGVPEAAWPWGSYNPAGDAPEPAITPKLNVAAGQVGQRYTDRAGILTLTVVSGTPAQGTPTAFQASQALNRRGSFNYDSRLRETSLEFLLLPYTMPAGSAPAAPTTPTVLSSTAHSTIVSVTSSFGQAGADFVQLEDATGFPQDGGAVFIGIVLFHYDSIQGDLLVNVRPTEDDESVPHVGDDVQLVSANPVDPVPVGQMPPSYGHTVWFLTF